MHQALVKLPRVHASTCNHNATAQVLLQPGGGGTPVRMPAPLLALHSRLFLDMQQSGCFDDADSAEPVTVGAAEPRALSSGAGACWFGDTMLALSAPFRSTTMAVASSYGMSNVSIYHPPQVQTCFARQCMCVCAAHASLPPLPPTASHTHPCARCPLRA